jgi:2-oxo-4-hydroxy-4-carboxy-5-ureidoimidazoline decarboxylase
MFHNFRKRLASSDVELELLNGLKEYLLVVRLRLVEKINGPGAPKVTGSLTSHVLDTTIGRPASGVKIELYEVTESGLELIATATTNSDGRTSSPMWQGRPFRMGEYELKFYAGEYFDRMIPDAQRGLPFLSVIPVRIVISEPESHYHIPLLVAPYAYSTYRGS